MRVLFLKHVINVGKPWEIKEVKPGYAANMLFPQWLAVELTPEAEKKHKDKLKKDEKHRMELIENRHIIAEELNHKKLEFTVKTWSNHKVYWWIWEKDIIEEVKKRFKFELTKKHIDMPDGHLKKIWEHAIYIKLWKDAIAKIFIVINEEK
jgi:ribosomal protein L9